MSANKNMINAAEDLMVDSIDAFCTEKAPHYLPTGHHVVKIAHFELIPEETVKSRYGDYTKKSYISVDLCDVKTGDVMNTRLYSGFMPYFLQNIACQTDAVDGMKVSEVLKYLCFHEFDVWVTYSPADGVVVNYREPRPITK